MREREAPSAAEAIAETMRREIIDELVDGDHIGSAEDLMDRFQVSGPTVRQAMRVLEAEGLIRVRRGNNGGFFAGTPSVDVVSRSASALLRRQGADLADLVAASQLIGPEVAALAARNPDPVARGRLLKFVEEEWSDDGEVSVADATDIAVRFGRLLGELSCSPSLGLIAGMLSDLVINLMSQATREFDPEVLQGYVPHIREGHRRLARAVDDGDAAAARAAQLAMDLIVEL
ncbi:FadR/GntR family transcriptional regulator [Mycobacterium intracellulare]|uniref:FadR/GntR family transcriptional regulator n=1 Tax=Mycobacterium intracellulare TaxID=1767 RepID=UPI001EED27EE|nr:GntR family transcriptional regulator [Mycobacterium intracellulare]MEE3753134.1 GntR family transcriptional regulator [Mycobacterium intracellulare]